MYMDKLKTAKLVHNKNKEDELHGALQHSNEHVHNQKSQIIQGDIKKISWKIKLRDWMEAYGTLL